MSDTMDKRVLWVFPSLALVEVPLLVRNLLTLPSPVNMVMAAAQLLLVIWVLFVWFGLRRGPVTVQVMATVALVTLVILAALILLEQALTHVGLLSANLALLLAVGGALISPRQRFAVYCGLLVLGWLAVILTHPSWDIPVAQQAILVFLGVFIGWVVAILRDLDRRRLENARDEAVRTAMRDPLTNLWNRRGMLALLPSMIGGARSLDAGIWCAFIDVRGLKAVNDSFGHAAGDELLAAIGEVLIAQEKEGLVPARWGGDEFCIFGVGSAPDAPRLVEDLRLQITARTTVSDVWDLSCGVASEQLVEPNELDALVARADEDMYRRRADQSR